MSTVYTLSARWKAIYTSSATPSSHGELTRMPPLKSRVIPSQAAEPKLSQIEAREEYSGSQWNDLPTTRHVDLSLLPSLPSFPFIVLNTPRIVIYKNGFAGYYKDLAEMILVEMYRERVLYHRCQRLTTQNKKLWWHQNDVKMALKRLLMPVSININ